MLSKTLPYFKIIALLEGCSFICLGITMPLKYWLGIPQPNYVVGLAHGILFILYIVLLLIVGIIYKWSFIKILLSFVVSLVPFGTFWAHKKLYSNPNI